MVETIPLQSGVVSSLPVPSANAVAFGVLCLLAGMAVPTAYGIERLQGFGRAVVSKIPYRPPPGMEQEKALRTAVEREESVATDDPDKQGGSG